MNLDNNLKGYLLCTKKSVNESEINTTYLKFFFNLHLDHSLYGIGHVTFIEISRDEQAATVDLNILDMWLLQFQALHYLNLNLPQLYNNNTFRTHFQRFLSYKNKSICIHQAPTARSTEMKITRDTIIKPSTNSLKVIKSEIDWIGMNITL